MTTATTATTAYRALPSDERQEFRLPALLKDHIAKAAALSGQTVADYITAILAEHVVRDLAAGTEWPLTVSEQETLLRLLARPRAPSKKALQLAERADAFFGPAPPRRKAR